MNIYILQRINVLIHFHVLICARFTIVWWLWWWRIHNLLLPFHLLMMDALHTAHQQISMLLVKFSDVFSVFSFLWQIRKKCEKYFVEWWKHFLDDLIILNGQNQMLVSVTVFVVSKRLSSILKMFIFFKSIKWNIEETSRIYWKTAWFNCECICNDISLLCYKSLTIHSAAIIHFNSFESEINGHLFN